jgi:Macrocin-O-methyltransferase (TylF)
MDFAGARPEVERNLLSFGDPAGVELIEGWFSDTLKGWSRPLAMLWMDVDLTSSALDVLIPCLPQLDPRGIIFSHELLPSCISGSKIIEEQGPAGAIARVVGEDDPDYTAAYMGGDLGVVGRRTSLCPESYLLVNELMRVAFRRSPGWLLSRITRTVARRASIRLERS